MPRCQSMSLWQNREKYCHFSLLKVALILWHFDCSLDFFNFSLRGTKIHPKKPAFWRPIKSFIFLKYMPRLLSCHLEFQNFQEEDPRTPVTPTVLGDMPLACPVPSYFQIFSIYLKPFWEPC